MILIKDKSDNIYPAGNCTWVQKDQDISDVVYCPYKGTQKELEDCILGYIGGSGEFVPFKEEKEDDSI